MDSLAVIKTRLAALAQFSLAGKNIYGNPAWIALLLMALIPPLGQTGINHYAVGQYELGFLKFVSVSLSYLLTVLMLPYLPFIFHYQGWLLWFARIAGGPWYFYDIMQALDKTYFESNGFRSPINFNETIIPGTGGTSETPGGGALNSTNARANAKGAAAATDTTIKEAPTFLFNMALVTMIGGSLGVSGQYISAIFPGEVGTQVGSAISWIGAGTAGFGTLSMLGSFLGASPAAVVAPALMGGAQTGLPPLSQIIDKIQTGGAKESSENNIVLYVMGFIAFAGISLGVLRSKQ
jgi:hypothetical protein